jgi:hypothetical protein
MVTKTASTGKNWCETNTSNVAGSQTTPKADANYNNFWNPSTKSNSYFVDLHIYQGGNSANDYRTYAALENIKANVADVNWDDVVSIKQKVDLVNWDDLEALTKSGVNWEGVGTLQTDFQSIRSEFFNNVNWANIGVMSHAGVNWDDVGQITAAGINWDDLYAMTTRGINWEDIDMMTQAGINWQDIDMMGGHRSFV